MNELVVINQETNQPMTTSLLVAEAFDKRHDNVMRVIHKLAEDDRDLNFELSVYQKETGSGTVRNYPMYEMTEEGFTRLVMEFSGPKASDIKTKFNRAFYQMRNHIRSQQFNPAC